MNGADFVSEVQDIVGSGFSDDDTRILRWANMVYRRLVSRSGWRQGQVTFTGVTDQATYDLSDNEEDAEIYQIKALRVETTPYLRTGIRQAWDIDANLLLRSNNLRGLFIPAFDGTSVKQVRIYPTPTTGDVIEVWAILYPPNVTTITSFDIPEEYTIQLVDGVASIIKRWGDEIQDEAAAHETVIQSAIEELRRDANKLYSNGPATFGIAGRLAPS